MIGVSTSRAKGFPVFYASGKIQARFPDYVKSPFRYPGGKFYALKKLLPFISCVEHDEYREPFVGGGSVFFGKQKVRFNWINDLESNLITTYKVIADEEKREKLSRRIICETASRERHEEIKNFQPQTYCDAAFKTFYLNRTSYSGIIHKPAWGYKEGKSSPPPNWANFIQNAGKKLKDVKITDLDFENVINAAPKGRNTLLYLDPPYYHADQKRAYAKSFVEKDHLRLAENLRQTNFYFCLSYDDCEEIREFYNWAKIYELSWLYNTANKKGECRDKGNELVITNYNVVIRSIQAELF